MIACLRGILGLISLFFEKDIVDVNQKCDLGNSALFYAVDGEFGENADIVSFLLEHNAKIEEKNNPKMTPLIMAC
jgi:hypothetical protein